MATSPEDNSEVQNEYSGARIVTSRTPLAIAGIGFIYGAVGVFAIVAYMLMQDDNAARAATRTLQDFIPELILVSIGVFGAIVGVRLLRSVGIAGVQQPSRVINKDEWQVLREHVGSGDEEAVTQYIRLTSLTGFTGTFTKLGMTGLPLATIGLTLFFSILSISYPAFLELAKLTLGAFIGSFVQKQTPTGSSVKLPSGERVSVSSQSVA